MGRNIFEPAEAELQAVVQTLGSLTEIDHQLMKHAEESMMNDFRREKEVALTRGNKKAASYPIAVLKLFEFLKTSEPMKNSLEKWKKIVEMDRKSILRPGNSKLGFKKFDNILSEGSRWKRLRSGPDEVKEFAGAYIGLADRIKAKSNKYAIDWAHQIVTSDERLDDYIDLTGEAERTAMLMHISAGREILPTMLAAKIQQLDIEKIDSWTNEDVADALFEIPEIRTFFVARIYKSLVTAYLSAVAYFWMLIDRNANLTDMLAHSEVTEGCNCEHCEKIRGKAARASESFLNAIEIAGDAVASSDLWGGDFSDYVLAILNTDPLFVTDINFHNEWACQRLHTLAEKYLEVDREAKKYKKETDKEHIGIRKELANANTRIKNLEHQILSMRNAKNNKAEPASESKTQAQDEAKPATSAVEMAAIRKDNERIAALLEQEKEKTKQLDEFITALLADPDHATHEDKVVTIQDIKGMKGVIIGGHENMTHKLRKALPNSTFFSPHAKNLDEEVVRNSEFVLICAGYLNHCISGHAVRLVRLHNIPSGYTDKTNVGLVLEDIQKIFTGTEKD